VSHSPANRSDLINLVRQWHQSATPWSPSGLGTRLDWGPPLHASHEVLSCRHLNRVIDHAVDDLTITVEAGLPLQDLQDLLAEQGQWLPVDWPRAGAPGSIGGLVARGLAGGLRQRHLGVRDQIIGIGLLRTDGVEARAGGRVVKNVAGYDLMRLLCGSWGSLALITELTLRLQPVRSARSSLLVDGDLAAQDDFRNAVLRSSLTPERCDWINSGDGSWRLRLVVSSVSDQAVEDQLLRLETLALNQPLSTERQPCADPLTTPINSSPSAQLLRLVLPPAQLQELLQDEAMTALKSWCWELAAGAGCGDGWCDAATPDHQLQALRRSVSRLGGEMTLLKRTAGSTMPAWVDRPSRSLIEAVKRQFDPKLQLSRGRLPGVDQETL
jgi:glycolate oxidase FAD binding subunit